MSWYNHELGGIKTEPVWSGSVVCSNTANAGSGTVFTYPITDLGDLSKYSAIVLKAGIGIVGGYMRNYDFFLLRRKDSNGNYYFYTSIEFYVSTSYYGMGNIIINSSGVGYTAIASAGSYYPTIFEITGIY